MNIFKIADNVNIKDAVNLYYPTIVKAGTFKCFLHDEKVPSMTFHKTRNIVTCFSCDKTFSTVDFVAKYFSISKLEAVKLLNKDFNLNIDINRPNKNYARLNQKLEAVKLKLNNYVNYEYDKFVKIFKLSREYMFEFTNIWTYDYQFMLWVNKESEIILNSLDGENDLLNRVNYCKSIYDNLRKSYKNFYRSIDLLTKK